MSDTDWWKGDCGKPNPDRCWHHCSADTWLRWARREVSRQTYVTWLQRPDVAPRAAEASFDPMSLA